MLIDRYPPVALFAFVPKLLCEFDRLLDDDEIVCRIKGDLARRAPHSLSLGRPSTPVEVILRLLVVKRLYGWSYVQVEHFVGDSLVLRQFCRVYLEKVPDDTTLLRWANLIAPETLLALNERVVELARGLKVTRGRKLRVDSTVVETTIHHPSDSSLLGDGVRVLSRLLRRAKTALKETADLGKAVFRTRTCSARRLVQSLHRLGRRKGEAARQALRTAYTRLIAVAQKTRAQAVRVCAVLQTRRAAPARRLREKFETFMPRLEQVIRQTVRRVLVRERGSCQADRGGARGARGGWPGQQRGAGEDGEAGLVPAWLSLPCRDRGSDQRVTALLWAGSLPRSRRGGCGALDRLGHRDGQPGADGSDFGSLTGALRPSASHTPRQAPPQQHSNISHQKLVLARAPSL